MIEGQSSVAVELLDQLGRAPDLVVLPVGGGGLAAGVTGYLRQTAPDTAFRFVEPAGGASLKAALAAGAPVTLPRVDSFVDGAAVARIEALPFARAAGFTADQVLLAPEDRICTTMLAMLNVEGVVLEPAGALSIDALADLAPEIAGKTVVSAGQFRLRTSARGQGTCPALRGAEEILHSADAAAPRRAARVSRDARPRG